MNYNRSRLTRRVSDNYGSDDNTGDLSLNTDGNLSVGLGNGLAIDTTDGSLGVQVGGFTVDFDCD
jgi:hypothetical protein